MKKIYTLFLTALVMLSLFSLQTQAQTNPNCNLNMSFTSAASPNGPNVIVFTNTSTGYVTADTIQWTFGDGTSSSLNSPTHTYTTAGTYHVCLHIKRAFPAGVTACENEICHDIIVTLPCNLTAAFISQPSTSNPLGVYFTNTSVGYAPGDSIKWSFGDGTFAYTANAYHAYLNAGSYTVCLHIRKASSGTVLSNCVSDICHAVTVTVNTCNLVALYSYLADSQQPNLIHFTNQSTGFDPTDSITWNFGDNSPNVYTANPSHLYTASGTYNACMIVKKNSTVAGAAPCIRYICKTISITIPSLCNLVASFTFYRDSTAAAPYTYHFNNTSTPLASNDSIRWTFGDGTSSSSVSPTHVYAQAGTYSVCLRVQKRNSNGTLSDCVKTTCVTIAIPPACTLHSNYTWVADPQNPLLVHFTNTTGFPGTTIITTWYFGDNSSASTFNAEHLFANAGTYYVCLRTQLGTCVSYHCDSIHVTAPVCTLHSNYTWAVDSQNPLLIHFTNTTTPATVNTTTTWYFGDNSSATTHDANHTFANAGTYYVCLRSQTGTCVNYHCDSIHVTAPVCTLLAGFTSYRDSTSTVPYTYHFTNTSTPVSTPDSVRWTFGDGSSSNSYSPNHTYAQPGTYTVCLRMQHRNSNGTLSTCISEICHTITVVQLCNIEPHYTWRADSANYKKIYFTNTTQSLLTNITATWSFGDGATATSWNAVHEYAQAGRYYVCLRIQYGTCVLYRCDSVTVTLPQVPCTELAVFHMLNTSATGLSIGFTAAHIYTDVTYTWTFGDGTGGSGPTATHTYAAPGTYTVCLTAIRNNGCSATYCTTVVVPPAINCNNITLGFTNTVSAAGFNSMTFSATSNAPTIDQVWTFSRVPATVTGTVTVHANNPTYTFADTGYYNVCLHATFAGGCVKEYCRMIHVTYPISGNFCSLQLYPNPATTAVNLVVTLTQAQVINAVVYNNANMQVIQKEQQGFIGSNTVNLNITGLTPGVYTVRVSYGGQVCYATFVKQ